MNRYVIVPGPRLSPYVRNFTGGGFPNPVNHLPAMPFSQLVIYLRGAARLLGAGRPQPLPSAFIAGPSFTPRRFAVEAGSEYIAVVFRGHHLTEFFDLLVSDCREQMIPLEHFAPRAEVEALLDGLRKECEPHAIIARLERFLLAARDKGRSRPVALPAFSARQLLLPASELAAQAGLSVRQFERRFLASYGLPLQGYRRLTRFSTALSMLLWQPKNKGMIARVAHDSAYFDHAHFIRDFREFIGTTPGEFVKQLASPESDYQFWRLEPQQLRAYMD